MASRFLPLLLLSSLALATPFSAGEKRAVTTDNTCGGANGYTCNASDPWGGPCCSQRGWCGSGSAYCGTGCQSKYSVNGSCKNSSGSGGNGGNVSSSSERVNTATVRTGGACKPKPSTTGTNSTVTVPDSAPTTTIAQSSTVEASETTPDSMPTTTPESTLDSISTTTSTSDGTSLDTTSVNTAVNTPKASSYTVSRTAPAATSAVASATAPASTPATSASSSASAPTGSVQWQHHQEWTFTGSSLPEGLESSDYTVGGTSPAIPHTFDSSLVRVKDGYVLLTVPGGQSKSGSVRTAEIQTTISNIKYASVKTTAIFGEAAGTCNGIFFYKDDTQEADIEWLSDPTSLSNTNGQRWVHFTNQPTNGGKSTYSHVEAPADPTTTEHEYRIDWFEDRVDYYIDGVLKTTYTTNVPSKPGAWIWNNWANGDPGWTGENLPTTDNVFKIKKIVMDYNTE